MRRRRIECTGETERWLAGKISPIRGGYRGDSSETGSEYQHRGQSSAKSVSGKRTASPGSTEHSESSLSTALAVVADEAEAEAGG